MFGVEMSGRFILTLITGLLLWNLAGENPQYSATERAAFTAYALQDYHRAAQLARHFRHTPHGKLLLGLCEVFDKEEHTLKRGLQTLEKLYHDPETPLPIRLEAGIVYARSIRLVQLFAEPEIRKQHHDAAIIFQQIIQLAPDSEYARDAAFYRALNSFSSGNPQLIEQGFTRLENFIAEFKGPDALLAPLHLLAEHEYIRLNKDYLSAVRHLEAGCKIGFSNQNEQRSALFRLGFFYYKYLNHPQKAEKALEDFRTQYPDSPDIPTAERFLKELRRRRI